MKSRTPTKPIYAAIIEAAATPIAIEEPFDRLTRKDFWNDPERWDGIDDPREVMIWEVRRPDIIDVRPKPKPALNPYANYANTASLSQLAAAQGPMLNRYPQTYSGGLFGGLLGY